MIDTLMRYLGEIVLFGGGGVAIGFALFKVLGQKWLEARFAELLEKLKTAQDEQVRHIQSSIDREIHRARKLYDREFETLPEAWKLLCVSFSNGMASGMEQYPNLSQYTQHELENVLSTTTMAGFERAEMVALNPSQWTNHYRRWANHQRLGTYKKARWAFTEYLDTNAIFFSAGIKEKFLAIDELIGLAVAEMEMRLDHPQFNEFNHASKLSLEGNPRKAELETIIQKRLWSSDITKSPTHADSSRYLDTQHGGSAM